jgi:flagellar assembly factor FliW
MIVQDAVRPGLRTQPGGSDMPEIPVIELVQPMPGFPGLTRYALVQLDDDGVLCALRSLEDPDLRFLVMPPTAFFPDYAPVVDDDAVEALGIETADDVLLLVVVNAGTSVQTATANLVAPVLVNRSTLRAQQVVLDDPTLSVAAPLAAA